MTAAEGAAWLARPFQRAPIVATRHFPGDRGSGTVARSLARVAARVHRPRHRHQPVRGPTASTDRRVLLHNGVPDRPQADLESPRWS